MKTEVSIYGVLLKSNCQMVRVQLEDIVCLLSNGKTCKAVMADGREHVIACLLGEMEHALPPTQFLRIHNNCVIGLQHVQMIIGNEIHLTNNNVVVVGKSYDIKSVYRFYLVVGESKRRG